MTIPKVIHYCWFGDKEIPSLEKQCIQTWQKALPEYKIMFWNEKSFDLDTVSYVKQAYDNKKYAFVSDYVRIYALYNFGGIYLDTDVEVLKSFDPFLNNSAFIGFENKTMIGTGIIGASKNNKLFFELLKYYNELNFVDNQGNLDTTTNVQIFEKILKKYGFKNQNSSQTILGLEIFERDFFCPKKVSENKFEITTRTVSKHHFSGSWLTERERKRGTNKIWRKIFRPMLKSCRKIIIETFGEKDAKRIEMKLRNFLR